jgi:hypothetical protein
LSFFFLREILPLSWYVGIICKSFKTFFGGFMVEETPEVKLARLEAENKALREQADLKRTGQLRLKVGEKGGLSVYGLGRFPVTLYKEQWIRLLDYGDEIRSFLKANDHLLKGKQ